MILPGIIPPRNYTPARVSDKKKASTQLGVEGFDKKKASTPIIVDVQADPKSLLFGGGSITAKSRWILFRGDRFFLPNHPTSIGL